MLLPRSGKGSINYFPLYRPWDELGGKILSSKGEDHYPHKYLDEGSKAFANRSSFNFSSNHKPGLVGFGTNQAPSRHYCSYNSLKHKLADAKDVMSAIQGIGHSRFPVLTPNLKGFKAAVEAGAKAVAVLAAASKSFSKSNINRSIEDSLVRYPDVALAARSHAVSVRGTVLKVVTVEKLAVHFHDTQGQALSNILLSLQMGISAVDSSVTGLCGCPFTEGATGTLPLRMWFTCSMV